MLRRILADGATQFVALRRELDLLEHNPDIQELRFPNRARALGKIRQCVALGLAAPGGEQLPA